VRRSEDDRKEYAVKSISSNALRLGFVLAAIGASCVTYAETPARSVRPTAQPVAPAVVQPGTPGSGLPSPSGLTSPLPAGLPTVLAHPAGLPDPTAPNISAPGTPAGSPPIDAGVANNANAATGGAAYGAATTVARGAPQGPIYGSAGAYTPTAIAQSFLTADANQDGELTRAEAQRLSIAPYAFEEMDRNHDGVITRFEYEDAVR
jgi:hypothetical protein